MLSKRYVTADFGFPFTNFTVSLLIAIVLLILIVLIPFYIADGRSFLLSH